MTYLKTHKFIFGHFSAQLLIFKPVALLSILLTACAQMPEKPVVTLCIIDYQRSEAICGETSGVKSTKDLDYNKMMMLIGPNARRVPLQSIDKSICEDPDNWSKSIQYVRDLETYAKEHCK